MHWVIGAMIGDVVMDEATALTISWLMWYGRDEWDAIVWC